jgi:hypothetical protein
MLTHEHNFACEGVHVRKDLRQYIILRLNGERLD